MKPSHTTKIERGIPESDLGRVKLEQAAVTSQFRQGRLEHAKQREKRDREQKRLFAENDILHASLEAKLIGVLETAAFRNFQRCGREDLWRTCEECGTTKRLDYQCNLKWCPRCAWKISRRRQELIKRWITRIQQPKHLVTTQRNMATLTGKTIREHTANLSRLRKRKVFARVKGGCVTVEVTNEAQGWHLHAHWLVNARWVDAFELSRAWGKLVGQSFAIVKVKDARDKPDYQNELSKYVVKSSDLVKWDAEETHQFIRAISGRRFFFTFGSLFKCGAEVRRELAREKNSHGGTKCDCGCGVFRYETELDGVLRDIREHARRRR